MYRAHLHDCNWPDTSTRIWRRFRSGLSVLASSCARLYGFDLFGFHAFYGFSQHGILASATNPVGVFDYTLADYFSAPGTQYRIHRSHLVFNLVLKPRQSRKSRPSKQRRSHEIVLKDFPSLSPHVYERSRARDSRIKPLAAHRTASRTASGGEHSPAPGSTATGPAPSVRLLWIL